MVQRLGLAVAMLPDAPVLLLDEPTAALDPDGLCAFYGLIEARRRARPDGAVQLAPDGRRRAAGRRFAVLVGGRLVAAFTARELAPRLADRGVMKVARRSAACEAARRRARGWRRRPSWAADQLIVPAPAPPGRRARHLRAAGAEIRGLTAEEGRLDAFYRELVGGAETCMTPASLLRSSCRSPSLRPASAALRSPADLDTAHEPAASAA